MTLSHTLTHTHTPHQATLLMELLTHTSHLTWLAQLAADGTTDTPLTWLAQLAADGTTDTHQTSHLTWLAQLAADGTRRNKDDHLEPLYEQVRGTTHHFLYPTQRPLTPDGAPEEVLCLQHQSSR